jgi:hypothetical protein
VADLLPNLLGWADAVCAVGSTSLYSALQTQIEMFRFRVETNYCFVVVSPLLMACGVGACMSCTMETKAGLSLPCVHGPVFDLSELEFVS